MMYNETSLIQGDTERAGTVQTREEEMSKYLTEKEQRPDSPQWYPVAGQEEIIRNGNTRNCIQIQENVFLQ